jgi:TLD
MVPYSIKVLLFYVLYVGRALVDARARQAFMNPFNFPMKMKPDLKSPLYSMANLFAGVSGVAPSALLDSSWTPSLVQGTSLQDADLECAFKASRDGWSAIDFHQKVDNRGSCLMVGLTRTGVVFGGFNPLGWMSTDDYGTSNSAFLWFIKGGKVICCPVLQGGTSDLCLLVA